MSHFENLSHKICLLENLEFAVRNFILKRNFNYSNLRKLFLYGCFSGKFIVKLAAIIIDAIESDNNKVIGRVIQESSENEIISDVSNPINQINK